MLITEKHVKETIANYHQAIKAGDVEQAKTCQHLVETLELQRMSQIISVAKRHVDELPPELAKLVADYKLYLITDEN